jgi:hypothetical protein
MLRRPQPRFRAQHEQRLADRACRLLHLLDLLRRVCGVRIDDERDQSGLGQERAEQSQALGPQSGREHIDAGGVTARLIKACHEAEFDRIVAAAKHDRNGGGRGLRR